mgnify:CR=1 FL=1
MSTSITTLLQLGWKPFFQQQLSLDELEFFNVARIVEQHRNKVIVISDRGQHNLVVPRNSERVCVGDWILFDETDKFIRVLERISIFQRKAAGSKITTQLIATNIDSLMIVCSLNNDFNLNRIERYLAIAKEAQVEPIVVLTKADQCSDVVEKCQQVQSLDQMMKVHTLNALDQGELKSLEIHCTQGKTIALMGSSGVGKSTLVNGLLGYQALESGAIREDDSKGRHTTTFRALKILPQGGILMDTPGMRELQLAECEQGVSEAFSEIVALAEQCRFSDCTHTSEPNCAVQNAIEKRVVPLRRFTSYQKLLKEQAFNSATLLEKKVKEKSFVKMINSVQTEARKRKKRQ